MGLFRKGSDTRMYLRALFTDRGMVAEERQIIFDGIRFMARRKTSDLFVIREVCTRRVYGPPPHGIVFDLGANIGAFSLYAARTAAHVYAFEPESTNFAQLEKNVALNHPLPITMFKKAVTGTHGTGALSVRAINKGASSLVRTDGTTTEIVETVSLDEAFSLAGVTRVDFLKIDIEGSEYALFEKASTHTLRKISSIVMEVHHVHGKHMSDIVKKLREAEFDVRMARTRFLFGMHILHATRK